MFFSSSGESPWAHHIQSVTLPIRDAWVPCKLHHGHYRPLLDRSRQSWIRKHFLSAVYQRRCSSNRNSRHQLLLPQCDFYCFLGVCGHLGQSGLFFKYRDGKYPLGEMIPKSTHTTASADTTNPSPPYDEHYMLRFTFWCSHSCEHHNVYFKCAHLGAIRCSEVCVALSLCV